jgi:hypothetical protein
VWIWNAEKILPGNEQEVTASKYLQQSLLFMITSIYFFHAKATSTVIKNWNNFHILFQPNLQEMILRSNVVPYF